MKYPQLVSMPSAISDWLEEQLEARGIDSVVYTRYILSLLHRDPADVVCHEQDSYLTHSQRVSILFSCSFTSNVTSRHSTYSVCLKFVCFIL